MKNEIIKKAQEKLNKMLGEKSGDFEKLTIEHLIKRCEEDEALASDILQEHKTWKRCSDYIIEKAKKSSSDKTCAAVLREVVYEWAEDYFHMDDKKKIEQQEKRKAEQKKEKKKAAPIKNEQAPVKKETKPAQKTGNEMEGQLDVFSLMGM